jgi:hypothetical protein
MTDRPKLSKQPTRSFADTTVVLKLEVGTSLHYDHLTEAIPAPRYINNYVRMEFYRTCIMHWIYLYVDSEHSFYKTFGDACKTFSEGFGREAKAAVSALATINSEGYSFASPGDKEACRQKLQDQIFFLALQFRDDFIDNGDDPTKCARIPVPIKFTNEPADRESLLREAARTFRKEAEARARCKIDRLFTTESYRKKWEAISQISPSGRSKSAVVKIQSGITEAKSAPEAISCKLCSQMGDAVIACTLGPGWKLHSIDLAHEPISDALGLECQIHPSDRALVKAAVAREASQRDQLRSPEGKPSI